MGPVPGAAIAVAAVQFHLDGVARTPRDVDVPEVDPPVPAARDDPPRRPPPRASGCAPPRGGGRLDGDDDDRVAGAIIPAAARRGPPAGGDRERRRAVQAPRPPPGRRSRARHGQDAVLHPRPPGEVHHRIPPPRPRPRRRRRPPPPPLPARRDRGERVPDGPAGPVRRVGHAHAHVRPRDRRHDVAFYHVPVELDRLGIGRRHVPDDDASVHPKRREEYDLVVVVVVVVVVVRSGEGGVSDAAHPPAPMLVAARPRQSHPRCVPGGGLVRDVRDGHRGIAALGGDGQEVGEPPPPPHRGAGARIERHVADGGVHPRSVVHLGPSRVAAAAVAVVGVVVALGEEEAVVVVVVVVCAAGRRRFRRLRERMTGPPSSSSSSSGGGGGGGGATRRPSVVGVDLRGSVVESDGDAKAVGGHRQGADLVVVPPQRDDRPLFVGGIVVAGEEGDDAVVPAVREHVH